MYATRYTNQGKLLYLETRPIYKVETNYQDI